MKRILDYYREDYEIEEEVKGCYGCLTLFILSVIILVITLI